MRVSVVAFATAGDIVGREPIAITLPEGSGTAELRAELLVRYPALEPLWPRLAIAVDNELVSGDCELRDGVEVALLPPVSGGAGDAATGRVALVDGPIDAAEVERSVADPGCGAVLVFCGTVRDHHAGRRVVRLSYSAHRAMAEKALRRIAEDLSGEARVAIVHRLGEVPIGEASVVIAVAAPHREAAYAASRTALERLKREAPIWKHESYADGSVAWREDQPLAPTPHPPRGVRGHEGGWTAGAPSRAG